MKKSRDYLVCVKKTIATPYIWCCFIILTLILLFTSILDTKILPNRAKDGTAHLANIGSRKPVMLNGTWEYYENQFIFPTSFKEAKALQGVQYVKVPGPAPNAIGYGTYRLQFDFISGNQLFALKVADLRSSARIYIDGQLISNVGFTSTLHESAEPSKDTQYVIFPLNIMKKSHELIIHTANYDYFESGITSPLYFGTQTSVYKLISQSRFSESISIISIGFLAVLLVLLLCLRIQMGNNLYLLLFTLCFAFHLIGTGQELISTPISAIGYVFLIRFSMINFIGMGMFMVLFLNPFEHTSRDVVWPFRVLVLCGPLLIAAIIFSKASVLYIVYMGALILFGLSLFLCFYILIKRMRMRRQSAYIQILALSIFVSFFVLQTCYRKGIVAGELYTGSFIFFVVSYVILQLSYVALRVSRIYTGNARLAQQMVVSDKMKDELMTITSHELRTPLHGMINMMEALNENTAKDVETADTLKLALTLAKRMRSTINDLYGFHENARAQKPVLKPHNLMIETDAVIEVFHYTKNNANLVIFNQVAKDASLVMADESKLWQILTNLVGNAIKYTPKGHIIISSVKAGSKVKISVKDSGIGMQESEQEQIFGKTVRLNEGEKHSSGLGMGLYVARRLTEQMGGEIWVERSSPNEGTCISFTLHLCTQQEYAYAQRPVKGPNISKEQPDYYIDNLHPEKATILALDDNLENLDIIRQTFKDCDYKIDTVQSAGKAYELLNGNRYDIVMLDVMMPEVNGFEVCRMIRKKYSHFELPVLLLTARDSSEDILTGFWSGANDYIIKPADRVELRARVFSLIALHQSVNQAIESELQFLHAQIQPHFLYNAFNTISAVALTDGEKASELIDDLGTYLRSCFGKGSNRDDMISIENELQMVQAYVRIEQERFGERLTVEIKRIASENFLLPLLTIQPMVENAIRHGSLASEHPIFVVVSVEREEELYSITITDNGSGIEPSVMQSIMSEERNTKNSKMGVGLKNVNRRLNLYYNLPLLIDNLPDGGTKVTIRIPIKQSEDER